ncbi:F-box/LRR-repeat protein At3g48880-like [Tasmannia lanceolata]|uniref:F-box/LRR-repeat protein At3g48880-like n=1 Tax=Tasmannia lanceolata TaxID=3420 RepID=UPI004062FBA2
MKDRKCEDLEIDCLINVFRRLGLEDMLLGVPFVCKSWYKASTDPLCWKVLDFHSINLLGRKMPSFEERFIREYCIWNFSLMGLLKLVVARSRGSAVALRFPSRYLDLEHIVYVSDECPALKCLGLPWFNYGLRCKFNPELLGRWKHLEILLLEDIPDSITEMLQVISSHCKNFVGLQLRGYVDYNLASAFATYLPKIKYLNLSFSFLSKENLMVILEGCKDLELLYLRNCVGFDLDEVILKKASHIRDFNCKGFNVDVGILKRASQLQEDFKILIMI